MRTIRRRSLALVELTVAVILGMPACSGRNAAAVDAGQPAEGGLSDAERDALAEDGGGRDGSPPMADGGTVDVLGDIPDASTDSSTADGSTSDTTSCDWGVFNEGTLSVSMYDSDGNGVPCRDEPCGFVFTIEDHRLDVPMTPGDLWYPSLLGSGTFRTWTIAQLFFHITWGWDVTWSAGQPVDVLRLVRLLDCPSAGANREPPSQEHFSLRDGTGALLLLNAGIPLAPNGQALLDSAFAPELSVTWKELGCPAYQGPGVGPEGGGRRTVGVVVRDASTGIEAVATWGRNATIQIRGEPYVLSVNQGWTFADGLGCGRAAFTVYRDGYLYRP